SATASRNPWRLVLPVHALQVGLTGYFLAGVEHPVLVVHEDQFRLVHQRLGVGHADEARDDDQVLGRHHAGGRAVDADHAGAGLALDGVGLETAAVVHVPDADGLVGDDVGCFHQLPVDGDAPLVVQVGPGYRRPVY